MKYDITVSVVLFNNAFSEIENLIEIFQRSKLGIKVVFIDNSPLPGLHAVVPQNGTFEYIFTGRNLGFGAGHNIAINKYKSITKFHLVMNADVDFEPSILEEMTDYLVKNDEIGMIGPKVLNPDGSIQYSAKLLPTPANLIIRRFLPFRSLKEKMDDLYELKFFEFNRTIEAPFLLGCFLLINTKVFNLVTGFDERFFMYMEDVDLTRRIGQHFKTIYYPNVSIYHEHGRESYKSRKLLKYHIVSTVNYFNKWGWIFDRQRKATNKSILAQF
jgi:GT2 family glycosyltransferase